MSHLTRYSDSLLKINKQTNKKASETNLQTQQKQMRRTQQEEKKQAEAKLVWPHLLSNHRGRQRAPFLATNHTQKVLLKTKMIFIYLFFYLPPLDIILTPLHGFWKKKIEGKKYKNK